ncbi:MAG: S8 family serine peptidase, partial [Myxococcota bacterium]
ENTAVAVLDSPVRYDNGHFGTCPSPGAPGCAVAAFENFAPQTPSEVIAFEDAAGKGSHGTNVAAIVHGVAPDTRLLGLNVFYYNEDEEGMRSRISDQIDALAWVADHASTYDIVAVNMSIGGPPDGPSTCNDSSRYDPIRSLWDDHGVLTVISSGNDGESNATAPPGCISLALTVGAHFDTELDDYDGSCEQVSPWSREIACFSNLSGMVDLLAPGVFVDAGGYRKSGTSMAAPHVAGAVAAWQSWFLQDDGAFKSPFWMHKRLLMQSSAPHVHVDGRRYQRLDFGESAQWDYGRSFPYWFRETNDNEIPSDGSFYETSFDVSGQGWNVQGAYLVLDIVHEHPEHLDVRVQGPGGLAMLDLPAGQAHFTGVVGRTVAPGALAALSGSPVDGTWTLRMRDTVGTHQGHYLQAALYFIEQGCTPACEGPSCGDDTCGGDCGAFCLIDGTCAAVGEPEPDNPCRSCIPNASATAWTPVEGKACDDGDGCTENDRCSAGTCRGEELVCPDRGPCMTALGCDAETGTCTYSSRPDGLTCSDGDPCTQGDACDDGDCVGTPVDCATPASCMVGVGCDSMAGECIFEPRPDGVACPGGSCVGGECVAGLAPSPPAGDAGTQGPASTPSADDDGGCGCRAVSGSSDARWAWVFIAGWALVRRRRRCGA